MKTFSKYISLQENTDDILVFLDKLEENPGVHVRYEVLDLLKRRFVKLNNDFYNNYRKNHYDRYGFPTSNTNYFEINHVMHLAKMGMDQIISYLEQSKRFDRFGKVMESMEETVRRLGQAINYVHHNRTINAQPIPTDVHMQLENSLKGATEVLNQIKTVYEALKSRNAVDIFHRTFY